LLFVILGAASPQFGSKLQKVKKEGIELMILLDVSNSMKTEDIVPSRLEKAKMAISHMIDKLNDDKIGLIVFAGDAYVQLPITTDYSSAKMFLSSVNPKMVPVQGTAIGRAIELGINSFPENTKTSKAMIVITDGENHEDDAVKAAQMAAEKGIYVHTIGMGLETGGPIPSNAANGEYVKDDKGNPVISKLDEKMLQEIASAGNGMYIRANNSTVGLQRLLTEVSNMQKSVLEERIYSDYSEKYQYFLLVGILLVMLEFVILGRKNKYLMRINLFKKNKK
ncbi:MAG: VWA domain-containing protein, partial [Bacteroidales bacterium]